MLLDHMPAPAVLQALDRALVLAHCSMLAVFPLQGDKRPFPGSHGCLDATTDAADIREMWHRWPGVLIGVATGLPSHLLVVDLDAKHGDAHAWFRDNRARLMPTRAHRTRSGGIHLLYAEPDGIIRNSASKLARGVDVRGAGGYIVWWPAAGCEVLSVADFMPVPDWLFDELVEKPKQPAPPTRSVNAIIPYSYPVETGERVNGILRFAASAKEGERNSSLFWAARRIISMAEVHELGPKAAAAALDDLQQIGLHIGLSPREVVATLKSAGGS